MITLDDQIAATRREIAMRSNVYPKWVMAGRMKAEEADKELARMRGVAETIEAVRQAALGHHAPLTAILDAAERPAALDCQHVAEGTSRCVKCGVRL